MSPLTISLLHTGHKYGVSKTVSVSFIKNYNNCVNTTRGEIQSQKDCTRLKNHKGKVHNSTSAKWGSYNEMMVCNAKR
jgi:hypothetical protein